MESSIVIINIVKIGRKIEKAVEFSKLIFDLCKEIDPQKDPKEYGLLLPHSDPRQSFWLDNNQRFGYYALRQRTELEFREKMRYVKVQTMDDTRKTVLVDDSQNVANLMVTICAKMGISNHEEYGLIRQMGEEDRQQTLTLKRNKATAAGATLPRDYEKLEKMKQKLQTDDDLAWLAQNATLRQQGVTDEEVLLLKRRYFYSDKNVDARDPVQLNLLYVQLRDSILNGKHPITQDEAINLAGIQCVVDYGKYVAEKMKSVHLDLKNYLPKEYVKTKGIDKKILQEHQKLDITSELDAKFRYIQLCRSLKTYGITFFLVKEKMKGKNKLVPRLFGVSRESVMRVDEKTKDILQTWPLTTVKRYASMSTLFTLDFGDYCDEKYTMQTMDGEAISQLLSGYIDIILKKRTKREHHPETDCDLSAVHEETVAPGQSNVITRHIVPSAQSIQGITNVAMPGVVRSPSQPVGVFSMHQDTPKQAIFAGGTGQQVRYGDASATPSVALRGAVGVASRGMLVHNQGQPYHLHDLDQPKRALIMRLDNNMHLLNDLREQSLVKSVSEQHLGAQRVTMKNGIDVVDIARNDIRNNVTAMGLAVGEIVTWVLPDASDDENNLDCVKLNPAMTVIGVNLKQLLENVKIAASDRDSAGGNTNALLEASRGLADALQDFMKSATPQQLRGETDSPGAQSKTAWKNKILDAANTVGDASHKLVKAVNGSLTEEEVRTGNSRRGLPGDSNLRDLLLDKGKAVGAATFQLVDYTKQLSRTLMSRPKEYPQSITNELIASAKLVGLATSQLIAHTKVAALNLEQPRAQQLLISAAKQVDKCTETVLMAANPLKSQNELHEPLSQASKKVNVAVSDLLACVQEHSPQSQLDNPADQFVVASDRLAESFAKPSLNSASGVGGGSLQDNSLLLCRQARDLAVAGNHLKKQLDQRANQLQLQQQTSPGDSVQQHNLEGLQQASKRLTEALSQLAFTIKANTTPMPTNPQQLSQQLSQATRALQDSIRQSQPAQELLTTGVVCNLELQARLAANYAAQLTWLAQEATLHAVRMSNYKIATESEELSNTIIPALISACGKVRQDPTNVQHQRALLAANQDFMPTLTEFLRSCVSLCPMVTDPGMQAALQQSSQQNQAQLLELQHAAQSAESFLRTSAEDASGACGSDAEVLLDKWRTAEVPYFQQYIAALKQDLVATGTCSPEILREVQLAPEQVETSARTVIKCIQESEQLLPLVCRALLEADSNNSMPLSKRDDDLDERLWHWVSQMQPQFYQAVHKLAVHYLATGDASGQGFEKCVALLNESEEYHRSGEELALALSALMEGGGENRSLIVSRLDQAVSNFLATAEACADSIPTYRTVNSLMDNVLAQKFLLDQSGTPSGVSQSASPLDSNTVQNVQKLAALYQERLSHLGSLVQTPPKAAGARLQATEVTLEQMAPLFEQLMSHSSTTLAATPTAQPHWLKVAEGMESLLRNLSLNNSSAGDAASSGDSIMKSIRDLSSSIDSLLQQLLSGLSHNGAGTALARQVEQSLGQVTHVLPTLSAVPVRPLTVDTYLEACNNLEKATVMAEQHLQSVRTGTTVEVDHVTALQDDVHRALASASQARYLIAIGHSNTEPGLLQFHQSVLRAQQQVEAVERLYQRVSKAPKLSEVKEGLPMLTHQANQLCLTAKELASREYGSSAFRKKVIQNTSQLVTRLASLVQTCQRLSGLPSSDTVDPEAARSVLQEAGVSSLVSSAKQLLDVICLDADSPAQKKMEFSPAAVEAQQSLAEASVRVATEFQNMVKRFLEEGNSAASKSLLDREMKALMLLAREKTPGQTECETGLQMTEAGLNHIQECALTAPLSTDVASVTEEQQGMYLNMLTSTLRQLSQTVPRLAEAVSSAQVETLPHAVGQTTDCLGPILKNVVACANAPGRRVQERNNLLEQTRTVLESFGEMLSVVRGTLLQTQTGDLNQQTKNNTLSSIQESVSGVHTACSDLITTCDQLAAKHGVITAMVNSVASAFAKLDESETTPSNVASFSSDDHGQVVKLLRQVSQAAQQFATTTEVDPTASATLAKDAIALANLLDVMLRHLATQGSPAATRNRLRSAAKNVGQCCTELLRQPAAPQNLVNELRHHVCQQLLQELNSCLQAKVAAPQACSDALAVVSDLQADLDTAVLFAASGSYFSNNRDSSGSLYDCEGLWHLPTIPEEEEEDYSESSEGDKSSDDGENRNRASTGSVGRSTEQYCDIINRKAERFTLQVKSLHKGIVNQHKNEADAEDISEAAKASVNLLRTLVSSVNHGAAAQLSSTLRNGGEDGDDSGDGGALQVSLLHAVRDVANSLHSVLCAAKSATTTTSSSSMPSQTTSGSSQLRNSRTSREVTLMDTSVEALEKSVKNLVTSFRLVNDRQHRGAVALESAVESMQTEVTTLDKWNPITELEGASVSGTSPESPASPTATNDGVSSSTVSKGLASTSTASGRPEDLVRQMKLIVQATSRAMTALKSGKQDDLLQASVSGRQAISDVSSHLRGTVASFVLSKYRQEEDNCTAAKSQLSMAEIGEQCSDNWQPALESGRTVVHALLQLYQLLLQAVKEGKDSGARMQMNLTSRRVSEAVRDLQDAARRLKGSDLVDPTDPSSVAEEELTGAADQIEAAANKLAQLRPKRSAAELATVSSLASDGGEGAGSSSTSAASADFLSTGAEGDLEELDEALLSSAKDIVTATSLLVQAAAKAQQELVAQGIWKKTTHNTGESTTWSDGLISAARMVSAATQNLCEAAYSLFQHEAHASMERVIAASKQVASSTAHLVVACTVKAHADSVAAQRLREAGRVVRRATDAMVKDARRAMMQDASHQSPEHSRLARLKPVKLRSNEEEDEAAQGPVDTGMNNSMVNSMKKLIETEADIIAKEKELNALRHRLHAMKKDHMKTKPAFFDGADGSS